MDITGTVDVSNPQVVGQAVRTLLESRYPGRDFALVDRLFADFAALYRGELAGFLPCETRYHDIHHVMDVTLAAARLIDGHEKVHAPGEQLGPDRALLGVIVALYHDAGYIRREQETGVRHGAEHTRTHVSRSARFMADYLPVIGLADWVPLSDKLVHFTGYEYTPDQIALPDPLWHTLGCLIGTADVIAQMADPAYLEKCRDNLYPEFELGGIARQRQADGSELVVYASAQDLLEKTPGFIRDTITRRLQAQFHSVYRYAADHFGGRNLYMEAVEQNCRFLETLLARNDSQLLQQSLRARS